MSLFKTTKKKGTEAEAAPETAPVLPPDHVDNLPEVAAAKAQVDRLRERRHELEELRKKALREAGRDLTEAERREMIEAAKRGDPVTPPRSRETTRAAVEAIDAELSVIASAYCEAVATHRLAVGEASVDVAHRVMPELRKRQARILALADALEAEVADAQVEAARLHALGIDPFPLRGFPLCPPMAGVDWHMTVAKHFGIDVPAGVIARHEARNRAIREAREREITPSMRKQQAHEEAERKERNRLGRLAAAARSGDRRAQAEVEAHLQAIRNGAA